MAAAADIDCRRLRQLQDLDSGRFRGEYLETMPDEPLAQRWTNERLLRMIN